METWLSRLGTYGIALSRDEMTSPHVLSLTSLGFRTLWLRDVNVVEHRRELSAMLRDTEQSTLVVPAGELSFGSEGEIASAYHAIASAHPRRLILLLERSESASNRQESKSGITQFVDALRRRGLPPHDLILQGVDRRLLEAASVTGCGVNPRLVTPRQTAEFRARLGRRALLAPEVLVGCEAPSEQLRELVMQAIFTSPLRSVDHLDSWHRAGYASAEINLHEPASDRFVRELAVTGPRSSIAVGLRAHVAAGADHVAVRIVDDRTAGARRPTPSAIAEPLELITPESANRLTPVTRGSDR